MPPAWVGAAVRGPDGPADVVAVVAAAPAAGVALRVAAAQQAAHLQAVEQQCVRLAPPHNGHQLWLQVLLDASVEPDLRQIPVVRPQLGDLRGGDRLPLRVVMFAWSGSSVLASRSSAPVGSRGCSRACSGRRCLKTSSRSRGRSRPSPSRPRTAQARRRLGRGTGSCAVRQLLLRRPRREAEAVLAARHSCAAATSVVAL